MNKPNNTADDRQRASTPPNNKEHLFLPLSGGSPEGDRGGGWGAGRTGGLKFTDYDIVFQEIPDEVTLAINLSNCPHCCPGCHSPHLQTDVGERLDETALSALLRKYSSSITCVCFMGGDAMPEEVCRLSDFVRHATEGNIKTAWYSGFDKLRHPAWANHFSYVKLGAYIEALGGLSNRTTNQRLYRVENNHQMKDITAEISDKKQIIQNNFL